MSMGATLSILGLYQWDNSIFDLMEYPTGFSTIQKETVRDNILVECAELECLYPNPEVMKNVIAIWSRKEKPYWDRVFKAASAEYNPLENYRRTETEQISDGRTEKHSGSDRNIASGSDRQTGNNTNTETNSGTDTVNNSITGYDSNTLVNHDSSATIHGHSVTDTGSGSNTQQYGRVDTVNHGENIEHSGNTDRSLLAFGNIGVTTSQEMLTQEMEIAKIINVIPIIIESFKDRFCILVY